MSKVTSKLQVTVPKAIAEQYGIRPGDDIAWMAAGDAIRVVPAKQESAFEEDRAQRVRLFDQATERQRRRERGRKPKTPPDRGWKREDLYIRGRSH
jgi:AbrB family looped-hinge helix DNA binding protein